MGQPAEFAAIAFASAPADSQRRRIASLMGLSASPARRKDNRAVAAAEERFDSLLEEEKEKLQDKVDDANKLKDRLEITLNETESKVDSLNTTIQNRNKQLADLKKDYDKTIDNISSMSHNQLSDFFAKRYGE